MARIPDDELERVKREVSLERLVVSRGAKLERRGADLYGLCPFHENREPSLVITPRRTSGTAWGVPGGRVGDRLG